MPTAERIFLDIPPPVNPNAKRNTNLITVSNIDGYTQFTPRQLKNFFKKVNKNGTVPAHRPELGKCWLWTAGTLSNGYGCFSMFGRMRRPHRVSWLIHNGIIPKGAGFHGTCVLHKCDNRSCVNPEHLFLGTITDNVRDMEAKGRSYHPSGDQNGIRKHPEVLKRGKEHYWHINSHLMPRGSKCKQAKLNEEQVRQIRLLRKEGFSRFDLAVKFSVSASLIQKIVHNDIWKHVTS